MGLPPVHIVVIDDIQILVELLIANQTIVVVFKVEFVPHGLMKSVSDGLSYYLLKHNFILLVPVGL